MRIWATALGGIWPVTPLFLVGRFSYIFALIILQLPRHTIGWAKKKGWVARTKSPDESYATKESVYKSSANVWCARKILRAHNTPVWSCSILLGRDALLLNKSIVPNASAFDGRVKANCVDVLSFLPCLPHRCVPQLISAWLTCCSVGARARAYIQPRQKRKNSGADATGFQCLTQIIVKNYVMFRVHGEFPINQSKTLNGLRIM